MESHKKGATEVVYITAWSWYTKTNAISALNLTTLHIET